jgi:ATP-dependent DNA helicase RecG
MAITVEQIDAWRAVNCETEILEFKEAKNQFDSTKLFQYCIAIANEGGGHLLLGIRNDPPRPVVGTNAFQSSSKVGEKLLQKLGFRVDVDEVKHPDGRVVVFSIPPRPKGTPLHNDGQYLMRSGECLVPMSPDRLRKIFAEGAPDWLEEISLDSLKKSDVIRLLDTQTFFELLKIPYPEGQDGVISRLLDERLINQSSDNSYAIKRLGGILLAKRLRDFPDLLRKGARLAVYSGKSKVETKLTKIGTKGYAVGFKGLVSFIMTQIPQNEVIKDSIRAEVRMVPDVVIRELVANALIHQDFTMTGTSVAIDLYSNRIDISNPGEPIVPTERFIDSYRSRNERLADIARRMGICEEKGSGIDKVIQTVEVFQLPAPSFSSGDMRTQVTIFGPKKFETMDKEDRVRACYQHCALKYVMSERMTNQTLRQRFRLSESKSVIASQTIASTVDARLIKLDEQGSTSKKFARYVPIWA